MNIEVNKYYKTRDGHKVRIYATDGGGVYPVHARLLWGTEWKIACYTKDGREFINGNFGDDIIAEWIGKPEMDVTVLPRRATWYAMNSFGIWCWYKERPDRDDYEWISFAPYGKIREEYAPKWAGRWEDSLTEIKQ